MYEQRPDTFNAQGISNYSSHAQSKVTACPDHDQHRNGTRGTIHHTHGAAHIV